MNAEIFEITAKQMNELVNVGPEVVYAASLSQRILMGRFGGSPLCFIGVIPKSILSDTVYIWMHVTPEGECHTLVLARHAKAVLSRIHETFPLLVGHCFFEPSRRWLASLGAVFTSEDHFELRRL